MVHIENEAAVVHLSDPNLVRSKGTRRGLPLVDYVVRALAHEGRGSTFRVIDEASHVRSVKPIIFRRRRCMSGKRW